MLLWIRAESRPSEQRAPLVPGDVARLVEQGIDVVVERSDHRIFAAADYQSAGATLVDAGSWPDAPIEAFVLGLKELPAEPRPLRHRHVFFGHAYKGQAGGPDLIERFSTGGGQLIDLEQLADQQGRRLAAFGYWAGYAGAALAALASTGQLELPLRATDQADFDARLARAAPAAAELRYLVIGALGRSGRGACAALQQAGAPVTAWDLEETRALDRPALVAHDVVVNTVLTTVPIDPFVIRADLERPGRRLRLLSDVTCDCDSPLNLFPIYRAPTTWQQPVERVAGIEPPMDVIAIDNLPSLLPRQSSTDFSAALVGHIAALDRGGGVWQSSRDAFQLAGAGSAATR
jgi:saccharopine dehydrogenase (NAD+, L-lysine-forming)